MNDLNSILVEGVVTTTPELSLVEGTTRCVFAVRSRKLTEPVENAFFRVQVAGHLADRCGEELAVGSRVRVVGRMATGDWKDYSGETVHGLMVIAEHIELVGGK